MWLYIAEGILVISLAGIVYFAIRTYPLAREQEQEMRTSRGGRVDWNAIYRFDMKLLVIFEKLLRKIRVFILKTDNVVSEKIDQVKKKSGDREGNGSHVLIELEQKSEVLEEGNNSKDA